MWLSQDDNIGSGVMDNGNNLKGVIGLSACSHPFFHFDNGRPSPFVAEWRERLFYRSRVEIFLRFCFSVPRRFLKIALDVIQSNAFGQKRDWLCFGHVIILYQYLQFQCTTDPYSLFKTFSVEQHIFLLRTFYVQYRAKLFVPLG